MPARNHVKPSVQARAVHVRHGLRLVSAFVRWREADPPAKASTRLGMSASLRPRSAVMLQSILDACIGVQCAIPTESHLVLWKLESDRKPKTNFCASCTSLGAAFFRTSAMRPGIPAHPGPIPQLVGCSNKGIKVRKPVSM